MPLIEENGRPRLDDVCIISDVLTTQKTLVKRYGNSLCEGSCDNFRTLCNTNMSELAEDQFDAFMYMSDRDIYPTEPAQKQKLTEAKEKFEQKEQEMRG